ncbi:hypothetical protein QTG54_010080 [Skeletonema marinoi]|uniref:Uncharacterized protein n=1 Tax=Skeletonema marinoi TaxID=267567 RepID=A0AAD8Y5R2_9STRA|nr:hypothetical protein QTG54_010080 [Skeletonema marinoi]
MPRKSARKINPDGVADPLATQDEDQAALDAGEEATAAAMEAAAAAEAAEAAVDSLGLDGVGVDVHAADHGDDEMALAAAAAAAAVQAADGMAVVVDQALLATAAAAAASQVAASMPEQDETPTDFPQEVGDVSVPALPAPKLMDMDMDMDDDMYDPDAPEDERHDSLLAARRMKDRRRYATMSPTQRAAYNAHRRDLYHKQGETARHRRRERERQRYHSLEGEDQKARNARRAKLERDRYQKLSKDELGDRNRRRRERAKSRKTNAKRTESTQQMPVTAVMETQVPTLPATGLGMSAVAAEVAEQVIVNVMNDDDLQVQV